MSNTVAPRRVHLLRAESLPFIAVVAWWIGCLAMYVTGWPIDYVGTRKSSVVFLFSTCLLLLVIGYRAERPRRVPHTSTQDGRPDRPLPLPIRLGFLASLALFPLQVATYSGYGIAEIQAALQNQDLAYQMATARIEEGRGGRIFSVLILTAASPLTLLALPYLSLRWFEERKYGIHCLSLIATSLVYSILVGRNQQVGMMALTVLASWLLSRGRRNLPLRPTALVLPILLFTLGAVLFGIRKTERTGSSLTCPRGAKGCASAEYGLVESGFRSLAGYATHGFEGLGRAMMGEWHFGGGISHSPALRSMLEPLNPFSSSLTITDQLTMNDWSATTHWSTGLSSLANDVPWALVPVIIMAVAWLFGRSLQHALKSPSPLAVAVFSTSWTYLFFIPQNLQIALSGPTYVGFIVLSTVFVLRRNRIPDRATRRTQVRATAG